MYIIIYMDFLVKIWELFWSVWPKNFYILVFVSALCEVASVIVFKISGNRGLLSIAGYVLGFFVVAFYAEALKYSKVTQSYPVWLVSVAILLVIASALILHEKISWLWLIGFIFAVIGVAIINLSLPPE